MEQTGHNWDTFSDPISVYFGSMSQKVLKLYVQSVRIVSNGTNKGQPSNFLLKFTFSRLIFTNHLKYQTLAVLYQINFEKWHIWDFLLSPFSTHSLASQNVLKTVYEMLHLVRDLRSMLKHAFGSSLDK